MTTQVPNGKRNDHRAPSILMSPGRLPNEKPSFVANQAVAPMPARHALAMRIHFATWIWCILQCLPAVCAKPPGIVPVGGAALFLLL